MKKLLLLTLLSLNVGAAEKQTAYQITASGPDLASLQVLNNCINYSTCTFVAASVAGGEGAFRFHSMLTLSRSKLDTLMESCLTDRDGFKVTVTDTETKSAIPLKMGKGLTIDLRPVETFGYNDVTIQKNYQKVEALLKANRVDEAIRYTLKAYQIPLSGYTVTPTKEVDPNVCVTDHEKKTVSIGTEWITNACMLFRGLRHEAEHIHQIDHVIACKGKSTFIDHRMRERSAYLNDILNIRKFCADKEEAAFQEDDALGTFFRSYGQN